MKFKKPTYWSTAVKELCRKDSILRQIIQKNEFTTLKSKNNAFTTLTRSVIAQQISTAASNSIWCRILDIIYQTDKSFSDHKLAMEIHNKTITPQQFLNKLDRLQYSGLSKNKVLYITNIAKFFSTNPNFGTELSKLTDEEIRRSLQSFKGIGPWTADMFLIFYLMRPNVFPENDIGLHKSIRQVYQLDSNLNVKSFIRSKHKLWAPWKTVVAWHLWSQIDSDPIIY
ncbi:MAG: hypothetical protein CBC42_07490 [Betaproteobacteria bacterium TMED82]|nr:MAG: hypothetical protein CBC42_07490 [Betaproteobacteria bacterium TMED82]|tara:strand:+ start:17010 stop:17690 length:681 start_codon:yes stop_codon:yes gene_type:complete